MFRIILFIFFTLLTSNDYGIYSSVKWYIDLDCDEKKMCGYGEGKNYEKAIVRALSDLADQINIRVKSVDRSFKESGFPESFSNTLNHYSSISIGNIEITSMTKDFIEEIGINEDSLLNEYTEFVVKITYTKENKSIIIQDYMSQSGVEGESLEYTDIQVDGFTFNDLLAELKRNNIFIEHKDYIYDKTNSNSNGMFLVKLVYSY